MKYLKLLFWGLGSLLLTSELGSAVDEEPFSSDSNNGAIFEAANNFKCPMVFGAFPDPIDCAYYYVCVANVAVRKKCGILQNFDKWRRRCLPIAIAICGNDKGTTPSTTTVTKTGDNFKCPKFMGTFAHPNDCSKYYNCMVFIPTLKTCPSKQLFDTAKSTCKPEKEVNCGKRQRPGFITTAMPTESIDTEVPDVNITEEPSTIEVNITEVSEVNITEEPFTTEVNITEVTTLESTTEIDTTTRLRPTGPPDHTCDEDDVDCIITETGDIEDWFICPTDIGSFPHPSSDKLFIFCMNWIPSVKKCGMDLVYSKELSTCIETKYFVELIL